jgi:hypothetical protein
MRMTSASTWQGLCPPAIQCFARFANVPKIHYLRDKLTAATDRLRLRLGRSVRRTYPAVAGQNVPPVLTCALNRCVLR